MGTAFDLPIAIGILTADGQIPPDQAASTVFVGELSLDGDLRAVNGALALALAAAKNGAKRIILPSKCAAEAAVVDGIETLCADSLQQVTDWMRGIAPLRTAEAPERIHEKVPVDLCEVRGQHRARRALEIR